jgi:hypothetical protein
LVAQRQALDLDEKRWEILLQAIKMGSCTPFLGAGASYGALPLASDIASAWARDYDYPFDDTQDLARVAQFVSTEYAPNYIKRELVKAFKQNSVPDAFFGDPDEPHRVLARLPLPVYLTTNYDDLMVRALERAGKQPQRELCRWHDLRMEENALRRGLSPTPAAPLVFHLHGHTDTPESLVLTEDDYLEFLVRISKDENLIPPRIQQACAGTTLLFLGYKLADWDFRVLFRTLNSYLARSVRNAHVSVQLLPVRDETPDEQRAKAQRYLDKYFNIDNISVYWGTCRQFIADLRRRWEVYNGGE